MKRSTILLAGWYLLTASCAIPVALDRLAPQTKVVTSADFPCAHHDCGCRTAEQCHHHCCCFPKRASSHCPLPERVRVAQGPRTVRVSWVSVERCDGPAGHETLGGPNRMAPHLPLIAVPVGQPERVADREPPSTPSLALQVFRDPPEKVPLPSRA